MPIVPPPKIIILDEPTADEFVILKIGHKTSAPVETSKTKWTFEALSKSGQTQDDVDTGSMNLWAAYDHFEFG